MISSKKLMVLLTAITTINSINAQIKVFTGGNTIVGSTSSPVSGAKLQVAGTSIFTTATGTVTPTSAAYIPSVNAYSSASTPDYTWSGNITTGLFHPASNVLGFTTNGTERMRVHSNGCVGIGTTSPQEFFQLGDRFTFHNGATKYLGYNSYYDAGASTNKRLVADYASSIAFGSGDIYFNIAASSTAGSSITFTDALHIKNDGKIGIDNAYPGYKLDVANGDVNIPSSTSYGYRVGGNIILTQRNITSSLFVGNGSGNSTTASNNTAVGYKALYTATSATPNNAFGAYALYNNTTGYFNLAMGDSAMYSTTTGLGNVAIGSYSMRKNTTASNNTAVGGKTMYANTTGVGNAAFGWATLTSNTTGANSSAYGYQSLFYNTTGNNNSAIGFKSLFNNTTGSDNTALGVNTGLTCVTGSYNTFVGEYADAGGNNYQNATAVGYGAVVSASNKIRIGNASVTEIAGQVGWTTLSDSRFKTDVQENVKGLEFIKKLRPVTYKVNTAQLDDYLIQNMPDSVKLMHKAGMSFTVSSATIHSGFLAQEVELAAQQVGYTNTIVSAPANENDVYGIAYGELVVPLVKAMQEQNAQVDSLIKTTHKLDSVNSVLQNQLNDVVNNCCQTKAGAGTLNRSGIQPETSNQEQVNWLAQNKPNPFNKETTIEYNVIQEGKGSIMIFDMNGKLLKTIPVKIPGKGSIIINGNDFIAGIYYYSLVVNDVEVDTKKMILTE
ncbi:MAG: tail fiber domain-containing protein [Bacteroidota bacterium]|nr:tail fiber domain-containing protein [Bacteroidota bacterium]